MENIKHMRKRHEEEIEERQKNCSHKKISDCMPFMWAPGHMSHCVRVCDLCGKTILTTEHDVSYFSDKLPEYTKKSNWFGCPHREDCHYCNKKEKR